MADLESELARFEAEIRASSEASASTLPPPPQPSTSHTVDTQTLLFCIINTSTDRKVDVPVLPDRVTCAAYRQLRCRLHQADLLAMAMRLMPLPGPPLGLNTPHMVRALAGLLVTLTFILHTAH